MNTNIVEYPVNYHIATLETLEKRQKFVETDHVLEISGPFLWCYI